MCRLTNIHDPPKERNYRDEHGNAIEPAIVADYNRHTGHVDNADRMANSYTASRRTWKWTKKLFFHLLDLSIVNSYILLSSCGGKKISHRDFCLTFIIEMLACSGHESRPSMHVVSPAPASTNIGRLDTRHNKHWPGRNPKQRRCRVCSARGVTRTVMCNCVKCDVELCVDRSYNTSFFLPPCRQLEPRLQYMSKNMDIYKFFRNVFSPLCNKDITEFLMHPEQCLIPSPQIAFGFRNLSLLVLGIFRFL